MQPPWSTATSTTTEPGFISLISSSVTSFGAFAPVTSTAPMTRSASVTASCDVLRVRVERLDLALEDVLQVRHPVVVDLEHRHLGAETDRDARRVRADDAAAEDADVAAAGAGDAAEQDALAAALLLEGGRADLGCHATGDLAHRPQQRAASRRPSPPSRRRWRGPSSPSAPWSARAAARGAGRCRGLGLRGSSRTPTRAAPSPS